MGFHQAVDHSFLARVDSGHVDGDRSSFYPEFLVPGKQRRHLRTVNDIFARQACDVWTCPANVLPLDWSCSLAFAGHAPGDQFAACAAPEHKNIIFFRFSRALDRITETRCGTCTIRYSGLR